MSVLNIHPQLLQDCHHLGQLAATELLLHRNASLPWFILVPDTELADFLDLPAEHGRAVLADCVAVSEFIKKLLGFDKVNFAGLGNVVPQMHLHVIGRATVDPCWPQPVWGNLEDSEAYSPAQLEEWQHALVRMLDLKPARSID
ncbi:HIT domain-containing protein [Seongchinamella sediminis]|uniref:HIT domain-containing protein n=1 Tax=Seongchinamella sediminis TaxID=2283635 RepID=A0A3L7E2W0_9GAMM|nr:HIT domain-containing protein [Seongchinamella sediminis]RLQ23429.1 HIT domain-containing protein [Seongchinamella sediminis]